MSSKRFIEFLVVLGALAANGQAQDVVTTPMTTSEVRILEVRTQHATLIQLPIEPLATSVGDGNQWLVEKEDRWISIKPVVPNAQETNLAIITREGTLNFTVRPVPEDHSYTQNFRVMSILDDSKPLPIKNDSSVQNPHANLIREIQIAQNYFALQESQSPLLKNVQQFTLLHDTSTPGTKVSLLQTFRFLDTRDVILHFVIKNQSKEVLALTPRRVTVSLKETLFAPKGVSLGATQIPPGRSTENFSILDGTLGLSPNQNFEINLGERNETH